MRMTFEGSRDELCKVFNMDELKRLKMDTCDIKVGSVTLSCNIVEIFIAHGSKEGLGFIRPSGVDLYTVTVEGFDKKEEDLRKAKALVNKTKEAHKEAQRKLSELQKDEKL